MEYQRADQTQEKELPNRLRAGSMHAFSGLQMPSAVAAATSRVNLGSYDVPLLTFITTRTEHNNSSSVHLAQRRAMLEYIPLNHTSSHIPSNAPSNSSLDDHSSFGGIKIIKENAWKKKRGSAWHQRGHPNSPDFPPHLLSYFTPSASPFSIVNGQPKKCN